MLAALAAIFVASALVPLAYRRWPRVTAGGAVAVSALAATLFAAHVPAITEGGAIHVTVPWAPALGVDLALRLDGLALVFALLVTGIGALVLLYAIGSFDHGPRLRRLLALLLAFEGSMLGLVLADDVIVVVVFWELTTICSYFLIAFDDASSRARKSALQALVITGGGGLLLLVGALLLAHVTGTTAISEMTGVRDHALYPLIVVVIATAAFTKSAQVPFHMWLPNAMVAPTPVSTYLHSATMVKAGIFVLARFAPILGDTTLWTALLGTAGALTMVVAGVLAIVQRDLKLLLAYSTITALGLLTVLLGIGGETACVAFAVYVLAHAAYKATLFMVAGNIDHARGHRDAFALRSLAGEMPASAGASIIAAASMAGLAPLLGYLAKETALEAGIGGSWAFVLAFAVGGALLVIAAWIAAYEPFFRGGIGRRAWHDAKPAALVGPLLLAAVTLLCGVAPVLVEGVANAAASAIAGRAVDIDLALWKGVHGVHGSVLAISASTFVAGTTLYFVLARRPDVLGAADRAFARVGLDRAYTVVASGGRQACERLAKMFVGASLRVYIAIVIGTVVLTIALPLILHARSIDLVYDFDAGIAELVLMMIAAGGALGAAIVRDRFVAIICLSATGAAIALLFALLSALDLAITQIAVETLTVILLVAAFRHLPTTPGRSDRPRLGAAALAAACGLAVGFGLFAAMSVGEFPRDSGAAHIAAATADNVVNVIVTDHRALDTLGEITVLATSGIGVLALLRLRRRQP